MIPWTIHSNNPVIGPGQLHGSLDTRRAGAAHVLRIGDRYRMTYWGSDDQNRHWLLAAEAPVDQPNAWRAWPEPLLGPQPDTLHNNIGPGFPFLLPVDDRRWLLYFCGWGTPQPGRPLPNTTGVACSDDGGKTFRYLDQHPVIPLDRPYDHNGTGSVWVIREQGRFRMWYTAIGDYFDAPSGVHTGHGARIPRIGIAYAESNDGLQWSKPLDRLVVEPRGFDVQPYEYICSKPALVVHPDGQGPRYTLWVNTFGHAYRVHRLTSDDGLRWTWSPRVGPDGELAAGAEGTFDAHQRSYPVILLHEREFRCWYTGNRFGVAGMGYATMPTNR